MLGDPGVSVLHFDQDHDPVFFSFLSIKPAMLPALMLGDYSMKASLMPFVFFAIQACWETCFSSSRYSTFSFSSFLDHHTSHHACHDAWILLYECVLHTL
jgi:hypothetical protein